ncbi:MAG: ABC transporter permease, partial [Thermoplasmata archaeon]
VEKLGWPGPDPSKYGLLRVTTEPALPSTIFVDGQWRNTWELNWVKLPMGEHVISFTGVPGYVTPEPISVWMENYGVTTEIVATFVECGMLNVSVEPSLPATILVDGFPRGEGTLSSYVPPGTYNISFGAVEGYDPPVNQTITVMSGESVEAVGAYGPNSSVPAPDPNSYCTLRVVTVPAVPTTIIVDTSWTAQWGLDSLKLAPLNETTRHVVQFTDVPGYLTPNAVILEWPDLQPGSEYELEVVFEEYALLEAHTSPSIGSTILVNGIARNDWSLSVFVPEGTYHVTFRTVDDYAVPEPGYMRSMMRILPLFVFWGASVIAVWGVRKPTSSRTRRLATIAAVASVVVTTGLFAMGITAETDIVDVDLPAWAYVIGLAAVTLSFVSMGMMQSIVDRDVKLAILVSMLIPIPYALTLFMDLNQFAMSDMRLLAYLGSGVLVTVCGFLLNRSFRFSVLAFSSAGDERAVAYAGVLRTARMMVVLAAAGLILSGLTVYMVQHWTTHWMGTDNFGADIYSGLLLGAKTSILVGVISAVIASVLGAAVGLYSGYVGGWVDEVLMRVNDVVLSIPWLVLMIIVAALIGKIDLVGIILIIGLTGWSPTARMVRAQVLSIRERQFIERARAIGAGDWGIIRRHVLPNAFPLVFANTILTVAISILSEATLSFLGMRPIGAITWGTMLSYAQVTNAFQIGLTGWIIIPGMCIVLLVLGFSLLGYALDDIMNPKLRKR